MLTQEEIIYGKENINCTLITNSTIKVSYKLNNLDFFSKILTGTISVTTDVSDEKTIEIKRVSIIFRTYNLNYNFGIVPVWFIGILVLFSVSLLLIFRKRILKIRQINNLRNALR